jgi:flagellar hook-basal body complex protein FliE
MAERRALSSCHTCHARPIDDRGENVPLTDVVLAMQKSSLSFEATMQVRNKVLRAYEEIMNMPV